MKLVIRRNQADVKGFLGGHKGVRFSLYGKVSVSDEEKALIERYKIGDYALTDYETKNGKDVFQWHMTVNNIMGGQSVETDSVHNLLELEDKIKEGCVTLKSLLQVMATFGGEEVVEI